MSEKLRILSVQARTELTKARPRYNEPRLIRAMEAAGIGRPSTYGATMSLLRDRGQAHDVPSEEGPGHEMTPTWNAMAICSMIDRAAPELIDPALTARLEYELDMVADGRALRSDVIDRFYRGRPGEPGMKEAVRALHRHRLAIVELPQLRELKVKILVTPHGIYAYDDRDAPSAPKTAKLQVEGKEPQPYEISPEMVQDALADPGALSYLQGKAQRKAEKKASKVGHLLGHAPNGEALILKTGRFGRYVQLGNDPEDRGQATTKPWTSTVPDTEDLTTLTPERAWMYLRLNRRLGEEGGEEVRVGLGRYGPYVRKGKTYRSLNQERACEIGLEEALMLLDAPPEPGSATMSTRATIRRDAARQGAGEGQ